MVRVRRGLLTAHSTHTIVTADTRIAKADPRSRLRIEARFRHGKAPEAGNHVRFELPSTARAASWT